MSASPTSVRPTHSSRAGRPRSAIRARRRVASARWRAPPVAAGDAASAGLVTHLVSNATGVAASRITSPTRDSADAARARHIAMYLTHVGFSWSIDRVAAAFGRHRSTTSAACQRIEDLRDHPAFDAALDTLEACIRAAPVALAVAL